MYAQGSLSCIIQGCNRTNATYKLNGTSAGKEFSPYGDSGLAICNAHRQQVHKGMTLYTRSGQRADHRFGVDNNVTGGSRPGLAGKNQRILRAGKGQVQFTRT